MDKIKQEPVMTYGAVTAVIGALTALGLLRLSAEQVDAVSVLVATVVPVLLPLITSWLARAKVTPVVNPHDADGKPLVPVAVAQQDA